MERERREEITDHATGLKVRVSVTKSKTDSSILNLYAMPVDESGNNLLKWATRRTIKVPEDIESEGAKKEINRAMRWAAADAAAMVPRTTAPVVGAKRSLKAPGAIDKVVKELLDKKVNIYPKRGHRGWSDTVCRSTLTYFLSHGFGGFLEMHLGEIDYTAELQAFRQKLIDNTLESGRSGGKKEQAAATVDANLKRIQILFTYLYEHSHIPEPFSIVEGIIMGKAIPQEQTKSVPDSMFLPFCRRLENQVESIPRLVLGAILMADGGARTAEAAGTPIRKIKFYENYAIVDIKFQEKGGKRVEILKSKPSYRITVLSFWGAWMARRCIEKLGWDEDTEDLITTGPALSAWIRKELEMIDPAFIARAAEIEATNPDVDDDGHEEIDVSAYVLRRNAASRWLNIDGLTHDEIDMLLGHKRKIKGGPELYLTDETHQQSIAKKLERYIYNPQHTGNPIFAPVEINAETRKFDLIPFPVSRIKNTDSKPILVKIDAENAEPGEALSFIFPKGAVVSRNASRSVKWKGKEENVIGSNSDSFEEVEDNDGS